MSSLASFRLDGKDEFDIYGFDGENFRNKGVVSTFINLPARTKKRIYEIEKKEKKEKVLCPYQDFQLFDIPSLMVILEKEAKQNAEIRRINKVSEEEVIDRQQIRELKNKVEKGEPEAIKMTRSLQEQLNHVECVINYSYSVIYRRKIKRRRIDYLEKDLLIGHAMIIVILFRHVRLMDARAQQRLWRLYLQPLGRVVARYESI